MAKTQKKEWWQHNFNQDYLETYVDIITEKTTREQLSFLSKHLPLKKRNARVLDLACGHGRITFGLEKTGLDLTGLDYSSHFIEIAKTEAKKRQSSIKFLQGDMKNLPFTEQFDAIINIYTSFGYFKTEAENIKTLTSVHNALKPKGYFLIDLNNVFKTLSHFTPLGGTDKKTGFLKATETETLSNGITVKTTYQFDPQEMRAHVFDEWKNGTKKISRTTSIRNYTLPEIQKLFAENGFVIKNIWGDFKGGTYRFDSPRIIMLAQKK